MLSQYLIQTLFPKFGVVLGGITACFYGEKRKEYRDKQKVINDKIAKLHVADEEYYLTSEYLLKLASRAKELFESSEPQEKRQLLKMTLQNLRLKGRTVRYDWINPFGKIAYYASRSAWLERWYRFRRTDWASYLEYPELTAKQTQQLLTIE